MARIDAVLGEFRDRARGLQLRQPVAPVLVRPQQSQRRGICQLRRAEPRLRNNSPLSVRRPATPALIVAHAVEHARSSGVGSASGGGCIPRLMASKCSDITRSGRKWSRWAARI